MGGLPRLYDLADCARRNQRFVLAVSDNLQRRRFAQMAKYFGLRPCEPLVSRFAVVARSAQLAEGSVVAHFAVIGPSVQLMPHVLVMHNAVIGPDTVVDANCVVCADASIAGGVNIGADCFIGPNAAVAPNVLIAPSSDHSAGTGCLRSVSEPSVMIGNPARRVAPQR